MQSPLRYAAIALLSCASVALSVHADEATRVGTCADARSQMEYFCDPNNSRKDSMVAIGTACNNAKNNVKEACEGIVQPDQKYEFEKKE